MNIAIAGCGNISKDHLNALKGIEALQLVAVCDKNESVAARTSKEWNVGSYYTDFSQMLDKERISVVSILTPPESHAPLAVEAIKRGVNVLVEEPIT